jgi:hypothetical protein
MNYLGYYNLIFSKGRTYYYNFNTVKKPETYIQDTHCLEE